VGVLLVIRSEKKIMAKKMEGKKIAGGVRISVDHFFATRFFAGFFPNRIETA
jgi:hypothetical protein